MQCMERTAQRIWAPLLCLSWLVLATPVPQAVAGCLEDTRPVQVGEHVARLRSFLCTADDGSSSGPLVRVEFHRLSDMSASTLIAGQFQVIKDTLGHTAMAENEVYTTFQMLVNRFHHEVLEGNLSFSIETPRGGVGANVESEDRVNNRVYGFGGAAYLRSMDNAHDLDSGWNYYYHPTDHNPGFSLVWWRHARESDFQNYSEDNSHQDGTVKLQKFLLSQGCPKSSFIVLASSAECGAQTLPTLWLGSVTAIFDFASIDNISQSYIKIDGIIGRSVGTPHCRSVSNADNSGKTKYINLLHKKLVLLPGQRVLIPLKVSFSGPSALGNGIDEAQRLYNKILLYQTGTIFDVDGIKISRDKLLPPQETTRTEYVYGTEWRVAALDINGQRVTLARKSSNFLNLTVASPEASCPYLLAWNPTTEAWTEYGKVLHVARSKDAEQAHTTRISGFRSKFRLAEREPEIAYIDHAELTVELKDGRSLALTATERQLAARDDQYVILRMGELVDFEFKLPDDIKESDVNESRLTVFGYYEPIASFARK